MSHSAKNQNALMQLFEEGEALSNAELREMTGLNQRQVMRAAGSLVERGFLARAEAGVFKLTEAGVSAQQAGEDITSGPRGRYEETVREPLPETLRQKVWQAMRVMLIFATSDLASLGCDAPTDQNHENVRRYCKALADAGYLMEMPTRQAGVDENSRGFKRYRMWRDTGEIAPTYRNTKKEVYDHNLKEVFPCQA